MEIFLTNHRLESMLPVLQKSRFIRHMGYNKKKGKAVVRCSRAMQEKETNFYEILSLQSTNVGFDEIKKAYRNMVLQYHPDVCPPSAKEESTKRFVEVREAYETLSDPILRRIYDCELSLVGSVGFGFKVKMEEREISFPKEVWEKQLWGLKQQSHARLERKKL